MRVIISDRLSRDKPETTSVETQSEGQHAWHKLHGNTIVAETIDVDESGGKPIRQRPEVGKWLTQEHLHEWDALSAYSIDRAFRDLYDFVTFYHDFLLPNGKSLIVTSENIDMSTPDGRTMAQMRVVFAENELNKIRERNARASRKLRAQGYWRGGPIPFGYMRKRERDEEGSHWILVSHPENAAIVREIAEGIIAGMPIRAAARELTTRGIPTGRKSKGVPITRWHANSLARMLRNPTLTGHILWHYKLATTNSRETYEFVRDADGKPLRREPILDDATFAKLQAALKRPEQKAGRIIGASMLIRLAFCSQCDAPLWINTFTSRGTTYAYYACSSNCGAKSMAKDGLHKAAMDAAMSYGRYPETKRELIPGKNYDEELDENKARLQELDPDDANYENDRQELLARREWLRNQESEPDEWKITLTGRTVGEALESLDEAGLRNWLRAHNWRFYAQRDPEAKKRDTDAVPLVRAEGGEDLIADVAKATGLTADQVTAINWVPILAMARERGLPMDPDELVRLASA